MGRAKSPMRTVQKSKDDLPALRASGQGTSQTTLKTNVVVVESERRDKETMPPPAQVQQPEQEVEKAPTPPAADLAVVAEKSDEAEVVAQAEQPVAANEPEVAEQPQAAASARKEPVQESIRSSKKASSVKKSAREQEPVEAAQQVNAQITEQDNAPEQASARDEKTESEEPRMLSMSKGQQDLNKVSADGIVVGTGEDADEA